MEDIFDRNVHPLYSVMAFIGAAIVTILLLNIILNYKREKKSQNSLLFFFGYIIFYCIQDGIWGLLASGVINSDEWLMISSAVFHLSSAFAPLVWTVFFCRSLRELLRHRNLLIITSAGLLLVQLGMILYNFKSRFMFYVDETGNYQTTEARAILFYLQFFIYMIVAFVSIFGILKTESKTQRESFGSFLGVSLAPVLFDVFQLLYPDAPANSMGLSIACVIIQIFLMQKVETQMRELEAEAELQKSKQKELLSAGVISALSHEYGPLYLTDLRTGSLQVFRKSDMERARPVQQLAFDIQKYEPFIREYAARHVVEEYRESFLEWADPGHLDSIISDENISSFNYVRNMSGKMNYYQLCCCRVGYNSTNSLMVFGFRNVDDTVRRELEAKETLEKALEASKAGSKAKTQFLFNMSHDIRTPMNAILGYTVIARKETREPSTARYLDKINLAGNQLLTLVNQVLEMSRIESGTIVLEEKPIDIEKNEELFKTLFSDSANSKDIEFHAEIRNIKNYHLLGDNDKIFQIMNNLIGNAIKYTPEGGSIFQFVEEEDCADPGWTILKLTVQDTGIGMSPEFLPHLFEEFSRENNSTVTKIQGTGLGMSIVKRIVELMNGTIDVSSHPGVGTKFVVRIPLKIDTGYREETNDTDAGREISLKGVKILLVEDNEMNREIAEDILGDCGARVDTAEDGVIAVEKVANSVPGQYDVVLMDIQMPRMNGYEAARKIRGLDNPGLASVKIVAMTANAFEEDRKNALDSGMNGHIAKPINVEKLLSTLSDILR